MNEGMFCANGLQTSPANFRDAVAAPGKYFGMKSSQLSGRSPEILDTSSAPSSGCTLQYSVINSSHSETSFLPRGKEAP